MLKLLLSISAIILGALLGYCIVWAINKLLSSKKLNDSQIKILINWLVYACANAEITYGPKTGKLKLSSVYNDFVNKFPSSWINKISYEQFSIYVDSALSVMKELIAMNPKVKEIIKTV